MLAPRMGGLVADIWIAFLIRTAINFWMKLASAGWPEYSGTITDYCYIRPDFGCDYGEYHYTYKLNDEAFTGTYAVPYFMSRSKSARISGSVGAVARVMVSPSNPTKSVLADF